VKLDSNRDKILPMRIPVMVGLVLVAVVVGAQESSLGDVARECKAEKRSQTQAKHVYTTEEMPSNEGKQASAGSPSKKSSKASASDGSEPNDASAEALSLSNGRLTPEEEKRVKEELARLKARIAYLEEHAAVLRPRKAEIETVLANSKGSGLCNAQRMKGGPTTCDVAEAEQQELIAIERELTADRQRLQAIQEPLRQAGYGSSVYDP